MYLLTVRHFLRFFILFFRLLCFILLFLNILLFIILLILLLILLLLQLLLLGLCLLPFNLLLRNILAVNANPDFLKIFNRFLNNLSIVDNLWFSNFVLFILELVVSNVDRSCQLVDLVFNDGQLVGFLDTVNFQLRTILLVWFGKRRFVWVLV